MIDTHFDETVKTAQEILDSWNPIKRAEKVIQALEIFREVRTNSLNLGTKELLEAAEEMMVLLDMTKTLDIFKEESRALHYKTGQPAWRNKE